MLKEVIRFAIVGVIATAIHYAVYWLLFRHINETIAYTIGYFISFLFNYYLSAHFTFKQKSTMKNGVGFVCAHAFNYTLQVVLLNVFLWSGVNKTFAPIPVYCIAVPVNFLMVRLVFKRF